MAPKSVLPDVGCRCQHSSVSVCYSPGLDSTVIMDCEDRYVSLATSCDEEYPPETIINR